MFFCFFLSDGLLCRSKDETAKRRNEHLLMKCSKYWYEEFGFFCCLFSHRGCVVDTMTCCVAPKGVRPCGQLFKHRFNYFDNTIVYTVRNDCVLSHWPLVRNWWVGDWRKLFDWAAHGWCTANQDLDNSSSQWAETWRAFKGTWKSQCCYITLVPYTCNELRMTRNYLKVAVTSARSRPIITSPSWSSYPVSDSALLM